MNICGFIKIIPYKKRRYSLSNYLNLITLKSKEVIKVSINKKYSEMQETLIDNFSLEKLLRFYKNQVVYRRKKINEKK